MRSRQRGQRRDGARQGKLRRLACQNRVPHPKARPAVREFLQAPELDALNLNPRATPPLRAKRSNPERHSRAGMTWSQGRAGGAELSNHCALVRAGALPALPVGGVLNLLAGIDFLSIKIRVSEAMPLQ
jgi:hypothetical protein